MTHKFRVGDKIKAIPASNNQYSFTNHKNKWEGVITKVFDNPKFFKAKTTKSIGDNSILREYSLESKYFEHSSKTTQTRIE